MAAGPTYTTIASTTLASGSATIVLDNIPGTYTDLQLIFSGTVSGAATNPILYFNTDTANGNYGYTRWYAYGSGKGSDTGNGTYILGDITTNWSSHIVDIMNYANTTSWKSIISRGHIVDSSESLYLGAWKSTAAITKITLSLGTNYLTGSTATLIGIKAA